MKRKRFVSWAAVSSQPQVDKVSLSDQLKTNREHIAKHNGILVEELVVPGKSRKIVLFEEACAQIPAYPRLKELIDARAFDVLIYYKPSRLGREETLVLTIARLCELAGIVLYETDSPPDSLDNPRRSIDKQLISAWKAIGARKEVDDLVENSLMGKQFRAEKGYFANNINYGYGRSFDPKGKIQYHVVEEEARQFQPHLSGARWHWRAIDRKRAALFPQSLLHPLQWHR